MQNTPSLDKLVKILHPVLLDSDEKVQEFFLKDLLTEKFISVDLESDRNERFGHNLSLIQLGTRTKQFILDPIVLNGSEKYIEHMRKLLTDAGICKLFYSGMEDIQVLRREFNCEIHNIYDVQYALAFIEKSNLLTGLDNSVKQFLDVDLPEELFRYQRTNWSK